MESGYRDRPSAKERNGARGTLGRHATDRARGSVAAGSVGPGWATAVHYLAVLARVNALAVLPTTLFLFGMFGERTWARFSYLAAIVFVLVNANFAFLDHLYHHFWVPATGDRRKRAITFLTVPALMVLGLLAALLGLSVLSVVGVPLPSGTGTVVAMSVVLSVVYGIAVFQLEDALKNRHETGRRLEAARIKQQELEEQRIAAEIRALQALIQPHFIFNTLNSIAALIHDQPDRAEATTLGLARLMRHILEIREGTLATLGSELAFARAYLEIEQIRMGDRLRYEIAVPDDMLTHTLPAMLLQPLVENAVKHGARQRLVDACVSLVARESEGGWELQVIDNGPGFSTATGTGSGMSLVRDRLLRIYGEAADIRLERDDAAAQSVATLKIPVSPVEEVAGSQAASNQSRAIVPVASRRRETHVGTT